MVKKFAPVTQRGAAGQSLMNTGKAYNFANMYQLNRADDQINDRLNSFTGRADNINRNMRISGQQTTSGDRHIGQNNMNQAVRDASQLSTQTQNFNPAAQAMKAGNSAYQSGIAGFYAGGANSQSVQKIRKFGGIYQNVLNQRTGIMNSINTGTPNTTVDNRQKPAAPSLASQHQQAVDTQNQTRGRTARDPGHDMRTLSNLDWMLKTGRISTQEYYKAQQDDAFYNQLLKKHS